MTSSTSITVLALDVDGVLTDGSIWTDARGEELKRFHVRDGFGIKLWQGAGLRVAIISARRSTPVEHRARELGIDLVWTGAKDKLAALDELCARTGFGPARVAFVGDDWPDLPIMQRVGYAVAVADAEPAVKRVAHFVTARAGGNGAVRDAVEHLLEREGLLAGLLQRAMTHGHGVTAPGAAAPGAAAPGAAAPGAAIGGAPVDGSGS